MFRNSSDIKLNFIPIDFTSTTFKGSVLAYKSDDQLRQLRRKYRESHVFRRADDCIQCVPFKESAESLGEPTEYNITEHFMLARVLVHHALIRFLKSKGYEFASIFPITRIIGKEDLMMRILGNSPGNTLMFLRPQYEIESRLIVPHNKDIKFGLLFNFSVKQGFNATVSELKSRGIDVSGRYVVIEGEIDPVQSFVESKYKRKLMGKIEEINGTMVKLSDFRDEEKIDSTVCYLEPRFENFDHCLVSMYPDNHEGILNKKRAEIFKVTGAKHQVERLGKLIWWLKKNEPIKCSTDLSFTISEQLYSPPRGRDAGNFRILPDPMCVLRPGGSITVKWPVDPHLEDKGPFDTESFPKKAPRIAVIFPRRFKGEVEIFMRQFKDGIVQNWKRRDKFVPYSQGFIRKYRLTACDIDLYPLEGDSDDAQAYREKCLEVLMLC